MKEQLISFETAKLAKEKGFDWGTDCLYTPKKELLSGRDYDYNGLYQWNKEPYIYIDNIGEVHNILSAPTQSLLQKWLREIYEIYIEIEITDNTKYFYFKYILVTSKDRDYNDLDMIDSAKRHWNNERFKTYEEALEKGLQEALKLI